MVNGSADKNSFVLTEKNGLYRAELYDRKIADQLASLRVRELEPHFASLTVPYETDWNSYLNEVNVCFFDWHGKNACKLQKDRKIKFEVKPYAEEWARPFSIAEYAEALEQTVKRLGLSGVSYYADELVLNGFGLQCRMSAGNPVVGHEIERCAEVLRTVCGEAEKLLAAAARKNAVTTFFSFPATIRTACEQYLLYFVQFLEDLGIRADAEIKEDARRVLFSVSPADGPSALEHIRQALEVYLKLPGTPEFGAAASRYPNLAVQQLHANILHLQSQLTLAKASLQAQEATVEVLQLSNYQYRQLLSSEEKPKARTEPLIGDTVHVTEIECKGMKVDLPLILKRLKRVFGVGGKKIEKS